MIRPLRDEKGMALLLTLLLISVLVVAVLYFHDSVRSSYLLARTFGDGIRLSSLARSGVDVGVAVLAEDAVVSSIDTLHEDWAQLAGQPFPLADGAAGERLDVEIIDHSGKIQLNALIRDDKDGGQAFYDPGQAELLLRFLQAGEFGLSNEQAGSIVAALVDWLDEDDSHSVIAHQAGAENSYYQALEKPYSCRNGPLESLDELLLVRGITRELLDGDDKHQGIRPFLSAALITGPERGRININTAAPQVLQALDDRISDYVSLEMERFREDNKLELVSPLWYRRVREDLRISPDLISVSSTVFEIRASARRDNYRKQTSSLVWRRPEEFVFLSWQVD